MSYLTNNIRLTVSYCFNSHPENLWKHHQARFKQDSILEYFHHYKFECKNQHLTQCTCQHIWGSQHSLMLETLLHCMNRSTIFLDDGFFGCHQSTLETLSNPMEGPVPRSCKNCRNKIRSHLWYWFVVLAWCVWYPGYTKLAFCRRPRITQKGYLKRFWHPKIRIPCTHTSIHSIWPWWYLLPHLSSNFHA